MAAIVDIITRALKGSPLTSDEMDTNFLNLKEGVESASPPGFDFNSDNTILTINNLEPWDVQLFPNLGSGTLHLGHVLSTTRIRNHLLVDKTENDGKPLMLLKMSGQEVYKITKEGLPILSVKDAPPAFIAGGMFFDGNVFYAGESS